MTRPKWRMALALLCVGFFAQGADGEVMPLRSEVVSSERGSLTPEGAGWALRGTNMEGAVLSEFADGVDVNALEIVTRGNGHLFLQEVEVSADARHWRPLLGRMINLPSGMTGGRETVTLPPSSIGKYWRLCWRAGLFTDPALPVGVTELHFLGHRNVPERHLLVWSTNLNDYRENLDFLTRDLGATDVWMGSVASAIHQSQMNQGLAALRESGALEALRSRGVRYWLNEHETVNDMRSPDLLKNDLVWKTFFRQVRTLYAELAKLGFSGVVFDAEDYNPPAAELQRKYVDELKFADVVSSWSFFEEFGYAGAYYRRGLEFGRTFKEVWPEGKFIQLYEARLYAGKPGCRDGNYWWLQGIADAGVEIWIATEKTYGAGNHEIIGGAEFLHHWFVDMNTFIPQAYAAFPMATRIIPGFHPWNTRMRQPMYRSEHLDQQLTLTQEQAPACWIYCEGNPRLGDPRLTLDRDLCTKSGVTPEEYLAVFRRHPTAVSLETEVKK